MESKRWSSDVKVNTDARFLLNEFLRGHYNCSNPPSYETVTNDRPSFKRYNENTIKQAISQFSNHALLVQLRKETSSPSVKNPVSCNLPSRKKLHHDVHNWSKVI